MTEAQHTEVTRVLTDDGRIPYGVGITPNPYWPKQAEVQRRQQHAAIRKLLTEKIEAITEPRFVTSFETSEFIEALITMTDSRRILEIGTHTGFTTLHMLRAVIGKPNAAVVTIDARPAHDKEFFWQFGSTLKFIEGWTPGVLETLYGTFADFVFVDSDHSVEHTEKELLELFKITKPGAIFCFHDVPQWQTPDNHTPPPVREWLLRHPQLEGLCLRSCRQLDGIETWGPDYPLECSPGLGVFIRK